MANDLIWNTVMGMASTAIMGAFTFAVRSLRRVIKRYQSRLRRLEKIVRVMAEDRLSPSVVAKLYHHESEEEILDDEDSD